MDFKNGGLQKLLNFAVDQQASDVHLATGIAPSLRINGVLMDVRVPPLEQSDMESVVKILCAFDPKIQQNPFLARDHDGAFEIEGLCRFRYNIYQDIHGLSAVLRVIPKVIPTCESLGIPPMIKKLAQYERGLILITGATSSGKTSTMAAIVNEINSTKSFHIVTIEDPIEFIHPRKRCRLSQREVGRNADSFATALRSAFRQDPDVIVVGELRDSESVDIALKAAETGQLILSTVHTTDAKRTISRMVSFFPPEQQDEVRLRLSRSIRAIISQRLLSRKDEKGRVAAVEIMINSSVIQECIADAKKLDTLHKYMASGKNNLGSQTFDQHLVDLFNADVISMDTVRMAATMPADIERQIKFDNPDMLTGKSYQKIVIETDDDHHTRQIKKPGDIVSDDEM